MPLKRLLRREALRTDAALPQSVAPPQVVGDLLCGFRGEVGAERAAFNRVAVGRVQGERGGVRGAVVAAGAGVEAGRQGVNLK